METTEVGGREATDLVHFSQQRWDQGSVMIGSRAASNTATTWSA